jgi:condensin complex subunit 2
MMYTLSSAPCMIVMLPYSMAADSHMQQFEHTHAPVHQLMCCNCRRSEALRKSLSDAFAGSSGDQGKPTLSQEALSTMFEQCIKLAAENKITDKNVWQLDLIQHLPSIVQAGQAAGLGKGFNFQKMSGGLDAGVTIYSKRVDTTYKDVLSRFQGMGGSRGEQLQQQNKNSCSRLQKWQSSEPAVQ